MLSQKITILTYFHNYSIFKPGCHDFCARFAKEIIFKSTNSWTSVMADMLNLIMRVEKLNLLQRSPASDGAWSIVWFVRQASYEKGLF